MDGYNFNDHYFLNKHFHWHGGIYTFGRERISMVDKYNYRDDYFKMRSEKLESVLREWGNKEIIEAGIQPMGIRFLEFSSNVAKLGSQTTFCDTDGVFTITFNKDFSNDRELSWIDKFKRWLNSPSPI